MHVFIGKILIVKVQISVHAETLKHYEVSRLVNKLLSERVTSDTVEVLSHTIPELSVHTEAQNRDDSIALVENVYHQIEKVVVAESVLCLS